MKHSDDESRGPRDGEAARARPRRGATTGGRGDAAARGASARAGRPPEMPRVPAAPAGEVCLALVRNRVVRATGSDPHPAAVGWHLQQSPLALAPMLRLCAHVLRQVAVHATRRWRPSPSLRAFFVEYEAVRGAARHRPPSRARRRPATR